MVTQKQTHLQNLRRATVVARNGILIIFGLTIIKALGGYITNIISLTSDALGSFSDIFAAAAIYIGLLVSQKPADKRFKYGYHRVETLLTLVISILVLYGGYKILIETVNRFFTQAQTSFHGLGVATAVISIITSFISYKYKWKTGKKTNSSALITSAEDNRNDSFVSFGVLISVVADKFNIPYIESAVAILIVAIILWTGLKHAINAVLYLLDYWNEPKVTNKIREILNSSRLVTAVRNIRLRHAGTYIFGEAFLEVNPFADSKDLRDEIHRLNKKIEANVKHLGDLVLYIDPPKPTLVRVAIPISKENGLHSEIAENPSENFRFLFVEIDCGEIEKFYSAPETFSTEQISEISSFLKSKKVNILISSIIRPLLYYNLRLNNIKVYPHFLGVRDVRDTVKLLLLDI